MRHILTSVVLVVLLFPALAVWETVTMDDLVERDGLYYKKFTNVPFSGKVTGKEQGSLKNGKKEGLWVKYRKDGQLKSKGTYKNGKKEGLYVRYWDNGQLYSKGTYKNGKEDGPWVHYYDGGRIWTKGTYKDGKFNPD